MSAGLSLVGNLSPQAPTTEPLTSIPSSAGERMGASWAASQAPHRYWNIQAARRDQAQKVIDDYHALTGERLLNPFDNAPTQAEVRENIGQPTTAIYAKRLQTLREKTANARASLPDLGGLPQDFLDADNIDARIGQQSGALIAAEERLVDTGNGIPAFLAGSAGEMASPHGVASMFLPVSRLPTAAAEAVGGAWLRNIGTEALVQAAGQAGVQLPASLIDYNTRLATGTEQTGAQFAEEVAGAAVGGAIFGGLFRGTHLGIRHLMGKGLEVPPAVKDAALVMESRDLYGDKNALGVPAAQHERLLDDAVDAVARGQAAPIRVDVDPPKAAPTLSAEQYSSLGPKAAVDDIVTPAEIPGGKVGAKKAFFIDPEGNIIDVSEIGHPAANERLNKIAGLDPEDENALFYSGQSPIVRIDATHAYGNLEIGVNAYEGGITAAQKRVIDDLERRVALDKRKGADVNLTSEVSSSYGGVPVSEIKDVRIRDANPIAAVEKLHTEATAPREEAPVTIAPPPEPPPGRPTEGGSPQDVTLEAQVKPLVDEGGKALPEQKQAWKLATLDEKEANIAIGCIGKVV